LKPRGWIFLSGAGARAAGPGVEARRLWGAGSPLCTGPSGRGGGEFDPPWELKITMENNGTNHDFNR